MRFERLAITLCLSSLCAVAPAAAQPVAAEPGPAEWFASEQDLASGLDTVTASGRRVVSLETDCRGFVLVTQQSPEPAARDYRIVRARPDRLAAALEPAGSEGFRIDGGISPTETCDRDTTLWGTRRPSEALLLMVRSPGAPPVRHRVVDAFGKSAVGMPEIDGWARQGFRPVAIVSGRLLLEHDPQAGDSATGTSLLIRGTFERAVEDVRQMARLRYRMVAAGARKGEMLVVLATSVRNEPSRIELQLAPDLDQLIAAINPRTADGLRLWRPPTIAEGRTYAFLVSSPEPVDAVEYSIVGPAEGQAVVQGVGRRSLLGFAGQSDPREPTVLAIVERRRPGGDAAASAVQPSGPGSVLYARLLDRARRGDEVVVATARESLLGALVDFDRESVSIVRHGAYRRFPVSTVTKVRHRDHTDLCAGLGTLIGLAAGVTVAAVATAHADTPLKKEGALLAWLAAPTEFGAAGFVVGWSIGSVWRGATIYVASTSTLSPSAPAISLGHHSGSRSAPGVAVHGTPASGTAIGLQIDLNRTELRRR
ncbi:MAG: hypothetical protein IT184_17745 [Acidobacteria bacterium]|nr:hypothetical protein [Acidobacteriota bacterium]